MKHYKLTNKDGTQLFRHNGQKSICYTEGMIVEEKDYDPDPLKECATGIYVVTPDQIPMWWGNYAIWEARILGEFVRVGKGIRCSKIKMIKRLTNRQIVNLGQKHGFDWATRTQYAGPDNTQTAGPNSTQTAGPNSTQTAGPNSTQTAGWGSTQTAGSDSTQTAGPNSTQTAGWGSTQTAGSDSTQTAGWGSTQTAGWNSVQIIRYYLYGCWRVATRVITVDTADKPYKFENGEWVEVPELQSEEE